MRPVRGAVTIDLLLWVAGTLLAIIFFIGIVWPWLLSIWYGSCWADARTDLREFGNEIEGAIRGPTSPPIEYRLTIGECIAGVIFINGEEARDKYNKLFEAECSEYSGYKSYMIAIPKEFILVQKDPKFIKEFEEQIKDLKESSKVWDAIKLWIKNKMGRVPDSYCYEFEHDFTSESIKSIPEGFMSDWKNKWNPGTEPYCLKAGPVELSVGGFNYYIKPFTCPATEKDELLQEGESGGGGTVREF